MSMINPYTTPADFAPNDGGIFVKNPDTYNPYQVGPYTSPAEKGMSNDGAFDQMIKDLKNLVHDQQLMSYYAGRVKDEETGGPVPGATVRLLEAGQVINQAIADNTGYFSFAGLGDTIQISSVGYKTVNFTADNNQTEYTLPRDAKTLPPVVLPPGGSGGGKNSNLLWIGLIAVVVIASQK